MFWIAISGFSLAAMFMKLGATSVTLSMLSLVLKILLCLLVASGLFILWLLGSVLNQASQTKVHAR